jgi:hypothetical protein
MKAFELWDKCKQALWNVRMHITFKSAYPTHPNFIPRADCLPFAIDPSNSIPKPQG